MALLALEMFGHFELFNRQRSTFTMQQNDKTTASHQSATGAVLRLTTEAYNTANVINLFRNTIPTVKGYVQDVILELKARDSIDFDISKAARQLDSANGLDSDVKFTQFGHVLLQTPEGFKDKYIPYLEWLIKDGTGFINGASALLEAYYTELSIFISSRDAKLSQKDSSKMYAKLQQSLEGVKDGLASFFDPKSTSALRQADTLFDRSADIKTSVKLAKDLNRLRLTLDTKNILGMTERIAQLLDLIIESSEDDKMPDVSGPAAASIAEGAMVAARYVEFVGVLRYRITEAIAATAIMSDMAAKQMKK